MILHIYRPNELVSTITLNNQLIIDFTFHWLNQGFIFYIFEIEGHYIHCFIHKPKNLVIIESLDGQIRETNQTINDYLLEKLPFTLKMIDKHFIDAQGKTKRQLAMSIIQEINKYKLK